MKFTIALIIVVAIAAVLAFVFFPKGPTERLPTRITNSSTPSAADSYDGSSFRPVSAATGLDPAKVSLGEKLFSDPILSDDNSVSCASCHILERGGSNGLAVSIGIKGGIQKINVPTVFNAGLNFRQFWDGRAATLEEQVDGPLENPLEMGSTWPQVITRLNANKEYAQLFGQSYAGGVTRDNISHALAEFERSLVTPNSAFDRYLKGDQAAMTEEQVEGYQLFVNLGCVACHQGTGIGGNMFQRMGAKNDYFANRGDLNKHDMGRFNVTGDEFDRHRFKVPSLRNVALTAPYFHDGSAATLDDAIRVMVKYQLGRRLQAEEQRKIVSFLHALTGEYQGKLLGSNAPKQSSAPQQ